MESINQRIAQIIDDKTGGNLTRFSEILGTSPQYVAKLIKEGGSVGIDPITKILKVFPDVEARWLILGESDDVTEIRREIRERVKVLLELEKYIPAMDDEDLNLLASSLRDGTTPEVDPYKFTVWETIIKSKKEFIEAKVASAMKKGVICKTKKAK